MKANTSRFFFGVLAVPNRGRSSTTPPAAQVFARAAELDIAEEVAELRLDGEHLPRFAAPARVVRGDQHAEPDAIDVRGVESVDDGERCLEAIFACEPGAIPCLERPVRVRAELRLGARRRLDAELVLEAVLARALAEHAQARSGVELAHFEPLSSRVLVNRLGSSGSSRLRYAGVTKAAATALVENTNLGAREIVEKAMKIAGDICIYTNDSVSYEELG